MTVQALLMELSDRGITLRLSANQELKVVAPKGQLSDDLLARLRHNKADVLKWLRSAADSAPAEALPAILPDSERLHEPFAPADLQVAFLMGQGSDMEHHVRPHYYSETEYEGLDPERYQAALGRMLERQAKNLPVVNDDLQLEIPRHHAPVQIPVTDLRGLPDDAVERALLEVRERMSRSTLPLDRWPWLECRITIYGAGRARIHYNNNNFFSDGYGTQKLLADTWKAYQDPAAEFPELELSFRDAALALAELEGSVLGEASKKYWLDRIPTLPPSMALPLRAGFDPRARSRLERREFVLPEAAWRDLKARSSRYGLTPTNVLYAIYAEILCHFGASRHFLLNNMVTHRFPFHPQIKDIVGNFASLYPLEVDWRHDEPFFERARRLQAQVVADLQCVYWSGVSVLQALNRAQKTPGRAICPFVVGSGLFMGQFTRPFHSVLETPQVMLDHQFWELSDGSLWTVWDVIEPAFPAGLIDDLWQAYTSALARFAAEDAPWLERHREVLSDASRTVRARMNATAKDYPSACLHEALPELAQRFPSRVAVLGSEGELTYGELYARADALAAALQRAGTSPREVPLILEKGLSQVIAAHAILLADGAYVPIDAAWPSERVHWVLERLGATRVVTRPEIAQSLQLPQGVRAFSVDRDAERPSAGGLETNAESLGYVIFTSGSTGTPKGVAMTHSAAMNTILDINARFAVTEADRIFGISSLCFDLSVYDIFGAAAAGATLVLPSGPEVTDPNAWLQLVRTHRVTVWNSVPALMQLLVDAALASGVTLPNLRLVMMSGDWIPVGLPEQIRKVAPCAEIVSLGGATEAAIWSIYYPIGECQPDWVSIPYGRPLANQTFHVLDENGADAPTWVPGHLHIGGRGLALGYFGDPEKTAASFVTSARTGERLYKTGDLGRYLPDGNIELLGRSDFQVKIQGYRVELGEIEHALLDHPAVSSAVVLDQRAAGGKVLAAFVIRRAEQLATEAELLAHLASKLPSYMVPGGVNFVQRFPLTSNGKLDRDGLRALGAAAAATRPEYLAPRSSVERRLVEIWEEVLEARPIGIQDDFFDLGGHSMAALRVITRVTREFGRPLSLGVMLQGRTVRHLAEAIERRDANDALVPLRAEGPGIPWFLVHPAGGNVLCYRELALRLGSPCYALQATPSDWASDSGPSLPAIAARYVQAIRQLRPHGPYLLGGWSSGGLIAFEMARQLEGAGEVVTHVVLFDTPSPLQHDLPSEQALLHWFIEDLNLGVDARELAALSLPPEASLAEALAAIPNGSAAHELDPQQMLPIYAIFRHIVSACRLYGGGPIRAPLVLLRAAEGRVSEFIEHPADSDRDWGWREFTSAAVKTALVSGSHHTILSREHVGALTSRLRSLLDGSDTSASSPKAPRTQPSSLQ